MNIDELKQFLEKFSISKQKIDEFILNSKLIEKNSNIFLSKNNFEKNQVYSNTLLYIKLKRLLPSTFLLDFIAKNSKTVEILTEKQALTFTYDKDLVIDAIKKEQLNEENYYIITYKGQILGYCSYNPKLKFPIVNQMNIGEYLRES